MEIAQAAHESARAGGGPDAEAADAAANIEAWRAAGLPPAQPHAGPKGSGAKAGNIKVCMRKRPLSAREAAGVGRADERGRHEFDAVSVSNPNAWFHELEYGEAGVSRLVKTGGVAGRKYEFHHTFGEADDNDEVYADCVSELVPFVLKGGVATCVAYGQTGAGKTYTQVGMQDRLARDLLAGAASMVRRGKWPDAALAAEFSFFENQGERCFDLQNHREELVLREDGDGHVHVAGLTSVKVTTVEELHVVLQAANQLRATAPTQSNPESSRSHAICTFRIGAGENIGTLRVIDLAGCERHESVDEHTPERIAEMKDINWSLGCLKECIRLQREALASRKPPGSEDHIPYRRSKLTMLLKDCFTSSNVRTVFLAHVAPTAMSAQYTKNTLDYASQMVAVSEKKKKTVHGITPCDRWSKTKFMSWFEAVDGGRFKKYSEVMQINGATMQHMPMAGKEGLTKRLEGTGARFAVAEADARAIYDAFHAEAEELKKQISLAKRAAGELKGPPIEPQLLQEMLAYYREYNPGFANQPKCEGIVRVFMKKAKTAGEPGTWKELLYAALSAKEGCDDPREVWARQQAGGGGGGGAEPEPEPELGPI